MPRVIDRAPLIRQEQAERQARLGLNGYGGGYGGAGSPGPNLLGTLLTGAARGLLSVPIGPDAGLSSYALHGFGIGFLGAKGDQERQQAIRIADERYERGEARKDAKLAFDYQESEQQAAEAARDEHYNLEVNALQVQDAAEDGRIDAATAEKLMELNKRGGVRPGQLGVLLSRIGDDVELQGPAARYEIFDKIEQSRSRTTMTRLATSIANHQASRGFREDPFSGKQVPFTPQEETIWKSQLKNLRDLEAAERRKADRVHTLRGLRRSEGDPEHVEERPERWRSYMTLAFVLLNERNAGEVSSEENVFNLAAEWAMDGGWMVVARNQNLLGQVR